MKPKPLSAMPRRDLAAPTASLPVLAPEPDPGPVMVFRSTRWPIMTFCTVLPDSPVRSGGGTAAGGTMWESTVEVTREDVVQAAPEHAWSLVSDSAAWSLRPGHFAFDVPQVTEAGWLQCWFTPSGKGLICSVQEVREEIPGQVPRLRSPGRC
jgi:hypothetical protein